MTLPPATPARSGFHDLAVVLPQRVLPTTAGVLERNGRVLILRQYGAMEACRHEHLFTQLAKIEDVSCLVVHGAPGERVRMRWFDHRGPQPEAMITEQDFLQAVSDWWFYAR